MTSPPSLSVFVAGRARTKGSLRVRNRATGTLTESVLGSSAWRADVATTILRTLGAQWAPGGPVVGWEPYAGPVGVTLGVWLPRPASGHGATSRYPDTPGRSDLDKLQRNIGDALVDARVLDDDGRICRWVATKEWAHTWVQPGVSISVEAL